MNTGRTIVLLLAVLVFGTDAAAWVQTRTSFGRQGIYWPRRAVPVVLQVGGRGAFCPDRGLWGTFGPCAEDVIRHAANTWARTAARAAIVPQSASEPGRCAFDGVNTVTYGQTACGRSFGPNTLAVTNIWPYVDGEILDADIVFNSNIRWDSYTGPVQYYGLMDLHRVAIHEFGHFWGLDHPDERGQTVPAIMNSAVSSIDRLQPDDINGITALYPPVGGPVRAQLYAIPPITARDQSTVRIGCETVDGCDVFLDCTDPMGEEYTGRVPGTIPYPGTRTLTARDIVEITGGDPWQGRLTCALRSLQSVSGQVWTRSGDGVLVNNTTAAKSASFIERSTGNTIYFARAYAIPSSVSSDISNLRIRCEKRTGPCEQIALLCDTDDGVSHNGFVNASLEPGAIYHMQTPEIERVIDYQWQGMGLSCFVVSTGAVSVQILTRTGGGALVNNTAVDPPLR